MGQQSVFEKNRLNLLKNVNKILLDLADEQYLKEHFLVGKELNKDKLKYNLLMKYVLCTSNCDVIEYIWKQIKGKN